MFLFLQLGSKPMMRAVQAFALVFSASLLAACADQPLNPGASHGEAWSPPGTLAGRAPRDVPEVRIQLPPVPRPWDRSPAELARALSALSTRPSSASLRGDGLVGSVYAVIAFKEPGSPRALQTGVRAQVSARTVTAGLNLLRQRGVEVVELLENIGAARVLITPAAAEALAADPLVDFVEPRQYASLLTQTTPWGIAAVRAPQAWPTTTGTGATVLIIDTGYDAGHPDLRALPISHCAGAFGGCDDGGVWHGTHVLGIVSARDNTRGVVGVGPGINGQALYVYGACDSATNVCPNDEVAAGLDWAIELGVKVVNMSLGGFAYDAGVATAVAQAWGSGIVLVAAAGNNGNNAIVYPAGYPNVVGVSGVGSNLVFASGLCGGGAYSSYGSHVDIAAPFEAYSTVGDSSYATLCGTSMAAPHVAGAAALVRAKNPTWTPQQVVNQLLASARDAGAAGWDPYYGYGIVDVQKAVGPTLTATFPSPPTVSISGPGVIYKAGSFSWSALPAGGNGSYTFMWHYRRATSPTWTVLTTDRSFALYVDQSGDFYLRVTVASAGQTAEATYRVTVGELICNLCGIP
jgi:subtilisin